MSEPMPDWDAVAEDAELSPRGMLAEHLTRVDDIDQLVIIVRTKDGFVDTAWTWQEGRGTSLSIIGMLETAKHDALTQQQKAMDE